MSHTNFDFSELLQQRRAKAPNVGSAPADFYKLFSFDEPNLNISRLANSVRWANRSLSRSKPCV